MDHRESERPSGLMAELKSIAAVARSAWSLVPRPHRIALGSASLIMAVTSAGNVCGAVLLGVLVDRVNANMGNEQSPGQSHDWYGAVGRIFIALGAIYLAREALNVLRRLIVENSCTRLNCNLQKEMVARVMKLDMQWLGSEKLGSLHGRIFRSIDGLIHFVRLMFLDCLPAFLTGIFALGTAVYRQPMLGSIMLGVIPLSFLLTMRQLNSQKGVRLKLMRDCELIDGIVVEQLSGVEYIRVANTLQRESNRLGSAMEFRRTREWWHHVQMAIYGSAKALNEGAFHILVLVCATYLALNGHIRAGEVLTFSVLFLNVMAPLNEIHRVIDEGHESSLRIADYLELLNTPIDQSFAVESNVKELDTPTDPLIEFDDVSANYCSASGESRQTLCGLTMSIYAGETIGVAGHSGSGKTTWIKLLLRLMHANEGTIRIAGVDLADIDREALAKMFGYVGQTPFIFSGSIAENIAYGCENASIEDIQQAASMANLHDDIMEIPGGYDALVAERGGNLSGGQRQRLAIARALLQQHPVLILDEATSALDNISERHIHSELCLGTGKRTTILIAHRLSTLRDCNRIFVFEHGRIAEVGSYNELVEGDGQFAALVKSAS